MRERTKETIRDGFGSLVSNAAAIRGAKNGPLWLTILFFVFSLLFPVLPIFISQVNINGSTFISSYTYGLERYIPTIATDLKENRKAEFEIGIDHYLTIREDGKEYEYDTNGNAKVYASYVNKVTNQYDFIVFTADAPTAKQKKAVNACIAATVYANNTTNVTEDAIGYTPSYMILFRDGIYVAIYANDSTKAITGSFIGDYKTVKPTTTVLADLLTVKDKDGNLVPQNLTLDDYTNGVFKNFKKVLDKSYETGKVQNTWGTSGIYLGVFAGLTVIMGLLMWVLTRGKNNPNNYYSPWLTLKIAARLALAPAIITLIVGFFMTQQAPLIFILTLGLRVMWMSMKELRPIQQ